MMEFWELLIDDILCSINVTASSKVSIVNPPQNPLMWDLL